jgi:beta-glucuronidase
VPGDWNTQVDELFWYESVIWYRKLINARPKRGKRYFLYFEGANYWTEAYLNGESVGDYEGGFTPFMFEVTDKLKRGENSIVVAVDSMHDAKSIPSFYYDWLNYGGITRPVHLIETPETYIHDYRLHLEEGEAETIVASISLDGPNKANQAVSIAIDELGLTLEGRTNRDGVAEMSAPVSDLTRWSPDNPKLYDVTVSSRRDEVEDKIGFRTIEVVGQDILLNGESIFLKGISVHEEPIGPEGGRRMDWDDARELLGVAKELGSNFVRLSHYPHNERTLRIADELGLLVWSEIPVYWEEIRYNEPYTKAVAKRMYKDSLNRDYNRASVVIWGVANETPITDSRNVFLKMLIDYVRSMDSTRLISAALNKKTNRGDTFIIEDPLGEHLDVISVNEYEGWYGNRTLDDVPGLIWETPYDKPMLFSEFGAGALLGARGGRLERFTEEHQAAFYEVTLEMAEQIPFLRGISPWILKDFRSPRRWHGRYQEYWNRKGLIAETGEKKPAFDVLQEWYESYDGPVTD